jgi:hypothetical protein
MRCITAASSATRTPRQGIRGSSGLLLWTDRLSFGAKSAAWKPITRRYGAGCSVMVPNFSSGSGVTSNPPTSPGASTRLTFVSRVAGAIYTGLSILQVRQSISCCRPSAMRTPPNGCFAGLYVIDRIHSPASSTRIWHPSTPQPSQPLKKKGLSAIVAVTGQCSI